MLKQRPEPPRERRGRKQTRGEVEQQGNVGWRSKEKGRFREPPHCLWSQGALWFCWVFLHQSRHTCASVWTADCCWPRVLGVVGGLSSAGCSLPGMLLGAHRGSPKSVCGQGDAFLPRARDYKEHSWEIRNRSEESKMGAGEFSITTAWALALINTVYFYFF